MNNPFKTGDRIVCIRDLSRCGGPAKGETVTVTSIHKQWVRIRGEVAGHDACDFAPAPAVAAPPAPFARSSKPRPKKPIVPGSRCDKVLNHLLTGKTLTQGEAILLGYGTRLAAYVHDLRRRDHNITVKMKEDIHGAPYAEYRLVTRTAAGNRKAA